MQSFWWMDNVPDQTEFEWGDGGEAVSPSMDWAMGENMSSVLEVWSTEQVGFFLAGSYPEVIHDKIIHQGFLQALVSEAQPIEEVVLRDRTFSSQVSPSS